MQLGEYLTEKGEDSINIVAISWTEGRYGSPSEGRLQRMVEKFHLAIKVIRETPDVVDAFSPLVYVPVCDYTRHSESVSYSLDPRTNTLCT